MHSFCVLSKRVFVQLVLNSVCFLRGKKHGVIFFSLLEKQRLDLADREKSTFFHLLSVLGLMKLVCFKIVYHINIICKKTSFPSTCLIFISDV